jgi:hypothetical protein
MNIAINDDYASIWNDKINLYYGYEETFCPVHLKDSEACNDADCDKGEWCFVLEDKNKSVKIIKTKSELESFNSDLEGSSPVRYLLSGIGLMLSEGMLEVNKMACIKHLFKGTNE